jgi:hypothetical protein
VTVQQGWGKHTCQQRVDEKYSKHEKVPTQGPVSHSAGSSCDCSFLPVEHQLEADA